MGGLNVVRWQYFIWIFQCMIRLGTYLGPNGRVGKAVRPFNFLCYVAVRSTSGGTRRIT